MREFIGPEVFANLISMLASNQKGAIWLSDCDEEASFYEGRCANSMATVLPAPQHTIAIMSAVKERGVRGVLATVGSESEPDEDIYCLSCGDVTTLLVMSQSCRRIIEECAGRTWINAANQVLGDFFGKALEIARAFARLRSIAGVRSAVENRDLREAFLQEVIDWQTLSFKEPMESALITPEMWREFAGQAADTTQIAACEGEDLLLVLASATTLFNPRGLRAVKSVSSCELWSLLKAGFDIKEFENDDLYWDLRSWQRRNGYPVLRDWRELDSLKALLDQRYWETDLQRFIGQDVRKPIAIVKMDLDNFKNVNERLGHAGGDEAIRFFARIVLDDLGKIAEVYRRGGDEVVAIISGASHVEVSRAVERVLRNTEARFRDWGSSRGLEVTPTASIGVVLGYTPAAKEHVVEALDQAQLQAKKDGKNRIVEVTI